MMWHLQLLFGLTVLNPSTALQCYVCDSRGGQPGGQDTCSQQVTGEVTECPQGSLGCLIFQDWEEGIEVVLRDCSISSNYQCTTTGDEGFECVCKDPECNRDLQTANSSTAGSPTSPPPSGVKCFRCNNGEGEDCDDSHPGSLVACPSGSTGCQIEQITGGETTGVYARDCTEDTDENQFTCTKTQFEGKDIHKCLCHGDECNRSFSSAGEGDTGDTTAAGQDTIQCYACSTLPGESTGPCTDGQPGQPKTCAAPYNKGCLITKDTSQQGEVIMLRDCSLEDDPSAFSCRTDDTGDGAVLHMCDCAGDLCNKDFRTAGEGQQDTTPPPEQSVMCYSCSSADPDSPCDDDHPGQEKLCTGSLGCLITYENSSMGSMMSRDCSMVAETAQFQCDSRVEDMGTSVHWCDCLGDLCNKDFSTAGEGGSQAVKCFRCNSEIEGNECDDIHPGSLVDCPVGSTGCKIEQMTGEGYPSLYARDCTEDTDENQFTCTNTQFEGKDIHKCLCHGDECNRSFSSAGDTGTDTTTAPTIRCYSCDSQLNPLCTDGGHGLAEIQCPASRGCRIARTNDDQPRWVRDCSLEEEWDCEVYDNEDGGTTQSCNCGLPLCNSDWLQAGSSSTASGARTTPAATDAPSSSVRIQAAAFRTLLIFLTAL